MGFKATLLDVAGGSALHDEVEAIEQWGRLISGLAVTLGVWGWGLMPYFAKNELPHPFGFSYRHKGMMLLGSLLVCVLLTYVGQKKLIDYLVDDSGGEERRAAAWMTTLNRAILSDELQLDGLDLSGRQLQTPEGKSFIAMFPFMGSKVENFDGKSERVLKTILENRLDKEAGGASHFYNEAYLPSVKWVKNAYNGYVKAVNAYSDALNPESIQAKQQQSWENYQNDLRRQGLNPDNLPEGYFSRIRKGVRSKGVPVHSDWDPHDAQGFYDAVTRQVLKKADASYSKGSRREIGTVLPKELSFEHFAGHKVIQSKWRENLQLKRRVWLHSNMSYAAVDKDLYRPILAEKVAEAFHRFKADAATFADGGENEGLGRQSMRASIVPPVALLFSLAGALVHLFKFGNYLASLLTVSVSYPARHTFILLAVVSLLTAYVMVRENPVTESRLYAYMKTETATHYAVVMGTVVKGQSYAYPINAAIREGVLRGFSFGYVQQVE